MPSVVTVSSSTCKRGGGISSMGKQKSWRLSGILGKELSWLLLSSYLLGPSSSRIDSSRRCVLLLTSVTSTAAISHRHFDEKYQRSRQREHFQKVQACCPRVLQVVLRRCFQNNTGLLAGLQSCSHALFHDFCHEGRGVAETYLEQRKRVSS